MRILSVHLVLQRFTTLSRLMTPGIKKKAFKTLWKEEGMLISSIFCFPHNVFYRIKNIFNVLSDT